MQQRTQVLFFTWLTYCTCMTALALLALCLQAAR